MKDRWAKVMAAKHGMLVGRFKTAP